jgi:hypothetical protein
MANTFKRKTANAIGTSFIGVYPATTTAVMIGGVVSNTTSATVNATVIVENSGVIINLIGEDTPIPAGTALSFIDGKIVLENGDTVKVKSSATGSLDAHLSIMEIT